MFRKTETSIYFETGVMYCRLLWPNLEYVPSGWVRLAYETIHIPSGRRYPGHIYIEPVKITKNLHRLLDYWSAQRPEIWSYTGGGLCGLSQSTK